MYRPIGNVTTFGQAGIRLTTQNSLWATSDLGAHLFEQAMRCPVGDRHLALNLVVDVLRSTTIPSVQQRIRRSNARGGRLLLVVADRCKRLDRGAGFGAGQVA